MKRAYKFRAYPTRKPSGSGKWGWATFQAVGTVKVRQHRPVPGIVKVLQLKREQRRWYVIVVTESGPVPLPPAGREVGVDMGVARFLTTSDGEVVANPRFLAASAEVIADLQRRKARARPGSGNRKRMSCAPAREWRKVRNRRRDFHHKTARTLVDECDVIALEKLNTARMFDADVNGALNIASRAGLGSGQAPTAA
jgi:putative transposase